jgi:hypothetical protein
VRVCVTKLPVCVCVTKLPVCVCVAKLPVCVCLARWLLDCLFVGVGGMAQVRRLDEIRDDLVQRELSMTAFARSEAAAAQQAVAAALEEKRWV